MAPQALGCFSERLGAVSSKNALLANNSHGIALKPFIQTHFGRMPPELREKVFIELLATPPSHAGHDFTTISPAHRKSTTAPTRFVHIKESWHQVTRTCRQVYVESRPIFFAAKSYYLAKPQEVLQVLCSPWRQVFRLDTITALCLKGLVREILLYTKEQVDEIMSNPNDYRSRTMTREELAMTSFKMLSRSSIYNLKHLKNLRTVGLCFLVSEEVLYVDLLYCLTGMQRGLVEFVDASHWLIRPQRPEDVWSIQYACFSNGAYGKGKDDEAISNDRLRLEEEVTDIDSRAPELQEGDERYVEVQVQWPVIETPPQEPLDSVEDDIASNMGPLSLASHETRLGLNQDQFEDNTPAETSDYDDLFADLEQDWNETGQSEFLGLDGEDSGGPQIATDADQEEDGILQAAGEGVSEPQPAIQSDHSTENASPSSSSALIPHDAPVPTETDRPVLPETDGEDTRIQTDTGATDLPAHADLRPIFQFHFQSEPKTDQVQQKVKDNVRGRSHRKKSKYLLGSRRGPLLEISSLRNPHTEEEMEFYEEWQERRTPGNKKHGKKGSYKEELAPPLENLHGHRVEDPPMAGTTKSPQQERPSAASQDPLRVLVRFVQAGTLYLLFIIIAMIARPAETTSDARRAENDSNQQRTEPLS